jgi:hypothetical protein
MDTVGGKKQPDPVLAWLPQVSFHLLKPIVIFVFLASVICLFYQSFTTKFTNVFCINCTWFSRRAILKYFVGKSYPFWQWNRFKLKGNLILTFDLQRKCLKQLCVKLHWRLASFRKLKEDKKRLCQLGVRDWKIPSLAEVVKNIDWASLKAIIYWDT